MVHRKSRAYPRRVRVSPLERIGSHHLEELRVEDQGRDVRAFIRGSLGHGQSVPVDDGDRVVTAGGGDEG